MLFFVLSEAPNRFSTDFVGLPIKFQGISGALLKDPYSRCQPMKGSVDLWESITGRLVTWCAGSLTHKLPSLAGRPAIWPRQKAEKLKSISKQLSPKPVEHSKLGRRKEKNKGSNLPSVWIWMTFGDLSVKWKHRMQFCAPLVSLKITWLPFRRKHLPHGGMPSASTGTSE